MVFGSNGCAATVGSYVLLPGKLRAERSGLPRNSCGGNPRPWSTSGGGNGGRIGGWAACVWTGCDSVMAAITAISARLPRTLRV